MLRLQFYSFPILLVFSIVARAQDTTELPTVTVDGFYVSIPGYMGGGGTFGGHNLRSPSRGCGSDCTYQTDLTKAQVCSTLQQNPPKDQNGNTCTTSTYPPAPGIPSASGAPWSGNGCGAGPWSSAFASGYLSLKYGSKYSGDLNEPVANNPSIDFTVICNHHDACYTGYLPSGQAGCDTNFSNALDNFCNGSSDKADCQAFASDYKSAVNTFGNSAYASDQAQLKCAEWGDAMKSNGCSQ